jgi:hypothetical protein
VENREVLKKKTLRVLKAAAFGAILADGLIVLDGLTLSMWKHGYLPGAIHDIFGILALVQSIPSAVASSAFPSQLLANAYVVNAFLGAILFGGVSALRQLSIKNNES